MYVLSVPNADDCALVSVRRKALQPFSLSNGVCVEGGEWLCTPLEAMLQHPKIWVDPTNFYGFRHVDAVTVETMRSSKTIISLDLTKETPFTDTRGWQTWGTGRTAWWVTQQAQF